MLDMLIFSSHMSHSSIPYLVAPPWLLPKRSAAKIIGHLNLEKWRRRRSFQQITSSSAPLDRGHGGRWWTTRVTEYGGAAGCGALSTRSWDSRMYTFTSLTMFLQERKSRFRSSRVSYSLLPSRIWSWLVLCLCIGIFVVVHATNPSGTG
jgi:hypothetical protein